jgi:uncharacterized protein (DUF4415 family)
MPENKRTIATDLKKLDEHVVQPSEYEDAPEWTADELAQADLHEGGVLIKRGRGRPPSPARKVAIKFRLDPDVVERLRASGPGWQTRVNATLREAVLGRKPAKKAASAKKAATEKKAKRTHKLHSKASSTKLLLHGKPVVAHTHTRLRRRLGPKRHLHTKARA